MEDSRDCINKSEEKKIIYGKKNHLSYKMNIYIYMYMCVCVFVCVSACAYCKLRHTNRLFKHKKNISIKSKGLRMQQGSHSPPSGQPVNQFSPQAIKSLTVTPTACQEKNSNLNSSYESIFNKLTPRWIYWIKLIQIKIRWRIMSVRCNQSISTKVILKFSI